VGSDIEYELPAEFRHISIHAPRVGSDILIHLLIILKTLFQSTLPAWGATIQYDLH